MKRKNTICTFLAILILLLGIVTVRYYKYRMANEQPVIEPSKSEETKKDPEPETDPEPIRDNKPSGLSGLKEPTTYLEFDNLIKRTTDTFIVIGRTGCSYCEQYYPVLKKVSEEYGVEIVYLDVSKFSTDDYFNIMNSDLIIPGKCNNTKADIHLSDGFGTPLGLFINDSKTYDCIRGYKTEKNLVNYMKKIKYIAS